MVASSGFFFAVLPAWVKHKSSSSYRRVRRPIIPVHSLKMRGGGQEFDCCAVGSA
jgi:hypothetical protein